MKTTACDVPSPSPTFDRPIAPGASIDRATAFPSGDHHHIGLNTWESQGGQPPPPGTAAPYHVTILYPTREDLAGALRLFLAHGFRIDRASNHRGEAIYLCDHDGIGLEDRENIVSRVRDRPLRGRQPPDNAGSC